jgi:hypothetical protein
MRYVILGLLLVAFATSAYAVDQRQYRSKDVVEWTELERHEFYSQFPPHIYFWTINAQNVFGAELVDDVPDEWYCHWISDIVVIVGQWAGFQWVDPLGIWVKFYNSECPPGTDPFLMQYHEWNGPFMDVVEVWPYDGWYAAWQVTLWKCPWVHIEPDFSIGFVIDTNWGNVAPYCGLVMTDDYVWYGCGNAYWCFTYYGIPRWQSVGAYFGVPADICYALSENQGPSGSDATTWGTIKNLYK